MVRLITLTICIAQIARLVSGKGKGGTDNVVLENFLFDLEADPYENRNLWDEPEYAIMKESFESRLQYWNKLLINPQIPDSSGSTDLFNKVGGYTSWLATDYQPLTVQQKYNLVKGGAPPPNIVFVLVDDWGWNDAGWRSNYLSWTTPNIDRIAQEGVILENHYSHEICTPTRGAFLTGRFALRLGQWDVNLGELPLEEVTIAQEMKSAGYRTYLVGKWDVGFSTKSHHPINRGFDYFYGYLNGVVDYWTKTFEDVFDLQENENLVTDPNEIDSKTHTAHIFNDKVQNVISSHAKNYPSQPMFLYYAMQLIHGPWEAPSSYTDRCTNPASQGVEANTADILYNYCGLNLMLDEAIANLTCALQSNGMGENTVMVIVSDNGGEKHIQGNSGPLRGHKGYFFRGGVSTSAIVHSSLLPERLRGTSWPGFVHITDWLPTLMSLATNGQWTGSYTGAEIDGLNFWTSLVTGSTPPEKEIVFFVGDTEGAIQQGKYKYLTNQMKQVTEEPAFKWTSDLNAKLAHTDCPNPNLIGQDPDATPTVVSVGGGDSTGTGTGTGVNIISPPSPINGPGTLPSPPNPNAGTTTTTTTTDTTEDTTSTTTTTTGEETATTETTETTETTGETTETTGEATTPEETTDVSSVTIPATPDTLPVAPAVSLYTVLMVGGVVCFLVAAMGIRVYTVNTDGDGLDKMVTDLEPSEQTALAISASMSTSTRSQRHKNYQTMFDSDNEESKRLLEKDSLAYEAEDDHSRVEEGRAQESVEIVDKAAEAANKETDQEETKSEKQQQQQVEEQEEMKNDIEENLAEESKTEESYQQLGDGHMSDGSGYSTPYEDDERKD